MFNIGLCLMCCIVLDIRRVGYWTVFDVLNCVGYWTLFDVLNCLGY